MQIFSKLARYAAPAFLAAALSIGAHAQSRDVKYYAHTPVGNTENDKHLSLNMRKNPQVFSQEVEYFGRFDRGKDLYLIATINLSGKISELRGSFYKSMQNFEQAHSSRCELLARNLYSSQEGRACVSKYNSCKEMLDCAGVNDPELNFDEEAAKINRSHVSYLDTVLSDVTFQNAHAALLESCGIGDIIGSLYKQAFNARTVARTDCRSRLKGFTRALYVWRPGSYKPPVIGARVWNAPEEVVSDTLWKPGRFIGVKVVDLTGDGAYDFVYSFIESGAQKNLVARGRADEPAFRGPSKNYRLEGVFDGPFSIGDIDGDGLPEIYVDGRYALEWDGRKMSKIIIKSHRR